MVPRRRRSHEFAKATKYGDLGRRKVPEWTPEAGPSGTLTKLKIKLKSRVGDCNLRQEDLGDDYYHHHHLISKYYVKRI